jgi:1-phosphofructokinase family hexose kinase
VLIAGPNLTIDRTLTIADLRPGEVLRFDSAVITPGGKGVNVARAAGCLGASATLVGFTPGHTGAAVAGMLADEGVTLVRVPVAGEVRSSAIVLEPSGRVTVMNEPGPPLADGDWERLEDALDANLDGQALLAVSGSMPPGTPADGCARLVALARRRGVLAVVDTSGPGLAAAVAAGADVVTPNLAEAEAMLHGRADEPTEAGDPEAVRRRATAAAQALLEAGARHAIVTAGEVGAAVADGGEPLWIPSPDVAVRNPIGAGDALVGGLAVALERGEPVRRAAARGVAAGAASVETERAGTLDRDRADQLIGER